MDESAEVIGSIERISCWKGISLHKLDSCTQNMMKLANLEPDDVKSYKVGFMFNQDYAVCPAFADTANEDSKESLGLIEPMMIKTNTSAYSDADGNKQRKTYTRTRRPFCCCTTGCFGNKVNLQTREYIMTYEIGDKSKPTIVLIHGYGGSALVFFKLYKPLIEKYHVIMIDLLGMGSSSRPHFMANDKYEAENFHLQAIEKWRQKMGLEKMTLIGHSFGGYMSAKYTINNPDRVNQLILWSPLGVEKAPRRMSEKMRRSLRQSNCIVGSMKWFTRLILNKECNLFNFIRYWGKGCARCVVKKYVRQSFPKFTDEEFAAAYPYFYQITMQRESGDKALYKILRTSVLAYEPYFNDIIKLKKDGMKISFVYGDDDWLDTDMNDVKVSIQLRNAGFKVDVLEE